MFLICKYCKIYIVNSMCIELIRCLSVVVLELITFMSNCLS